MSLLGMIVMGNYVCICMISGGLYNCLIIAMFIAGIYSVIWTVIMIGIIGSVTRIFIIFGIFIGNLGGTSGVDMIC